MFRVIFISFGLFILPSCTTIGPSQTWTSDNIDQQSLIILIQAGLRAHGYDPGPIDGSVGPLTHSAAHAFLRSRNLQISNQIGRALFEALYKDQDFTKPMPYVEGSIRSCFRWGPGNVLILATNLNSLICTVKVGRPASAKDITSATTFCKKSIRVPTNLVKCELIFDGQRLVGQRRLLQMLRTPSPDVPVIIEAFDFETKLTTVIDSTLQTEAPHYLFPSSVFNSSPPTPISKRLKFELLGPRGKSYCAGTFMPDGLGNSDFSMDCFGGKHYMEGKAVTVGVVPVDGQLLYAYEATVSSAGSQLRLRPPKNVIRFNP